MVVASLFLRGIPPGMSFREKVLMVILLSRFFDAYVRTEQDLMWVTVQLKKMEQERQENGMHRIDSSEWDRTGDEEVL